MCLLLRRIKSGCNLCSVLYYCSVCLKDHIHLMATQQASESLYECPAFSINEESWGPNTLPKEFEDLPFSLFSRDDGLGAIVDVTHLSVAMRQGSGRRPILFDA